MTLPTFTLDDDPALDPAVAGAKGAGLARLRAEGFDVPDAVVLPIGLAQAWTGGDPPAWLRAAVDQACADLEGPLAVRSSSTWEDGETSAHAGATVTVLDVEGTDDVLTAVRRCLDGSTSAQRCHGATGELAVILQRLVPAERAGVAFTADPVTGDRGVVRIGAVEGLAEALVQGEATGVDITVTGDRIDGDLGPLPSEEALAVAAVARRIEDAFGGPQDIEWAIADGQVHVVQARPITVLPVQPELPDGNNWQKDVAHYPEPLTPFGWSLHQACQDQVRAVFDEMGLMIRGLEERLVGGEVYGRVLPAFGDPDGAGSPPPAFVLGIVARLVPALRRRNATAREALAAGKPAVWLDEWHATDRQAMTEAFTALAAVDLTALDDAELVEHGDRCVALMQRGYGIHFRLAVALFHAMYRLHHLVGEQLGWPDAKTSTMLVGHSAATRAADEALDEIRDRVQTVPELTEQLADQPGVPVAVLRNADPTLAADLEAWMAEHAWALVNYDAGVPVLAERPTMVTRLLLASPEPVDFSEADGVAQEARAALPAEQRAEFDEALADARANYPVREDNTLVAGERPMSLVRRWMLEAGRRLMARGVLDDPGQTPYLFLDEVRAALTGADEGVAHRIARRRGEEAWARANPGPAYVGEQGEPPDISRLPAPLRTANEPVLWAVAHEYPSPVEAPADEDVLLAGVPASPGVAEGPARIIRSHRDLDRLQDGDVLVCQVTSPAWAPLFPLAAAVVADGGGALSHAAIASREHGLPAVLGTGDGMDTLVDGQRVRVDGRRGLVFAADERVDGPDRSTDGHPLHA